MRELFKDELNEVSGGRKIRIHISVPNVFTAIGAFVLGGPVAGGVVLAAMLAAQGSAQTYDILTQDPNNPVY